MEASTINPISSITLSGQEKTHSMGRGLIMKRMELIVFIGLIGIINLPLFQGSVSESLIFFPLEVRSGQWWRLITFPFVHISWYHLILDGLAFWLLWTGLSETRFFKRMLYALAPWATSLLLPVMVSQTVYVMGLCGLSGIAHGLTVITALDMMRKEARGGMPGRVGLVLFAGIVGKCIIELLTGRVFFHSLHLGNVGTPVVEAHAGGVLGGLVIYWVLQNSFFGTARK